jgi:hypothetical protein
MEAFSRTIREHPDLNTTVWETAAHLAASFFYFELSEPISELSDGSFVVKGAFYFLFYSDCTQSILIYKVTFCAASLPTLRKSVGLGNF